MYQDLHFYIDLDWENHFSTPEPNDYLSSVFSLVNFVYQYNANVYYSEAQRIYFTNECQDLDDNFSVSFGNKLALILENAKPIKHQNYVFEVCFASENTSLSHNKSCIAASVQNFEKQAILTQNISTNTLLLVKSNDEFERIKISYLPNIENVRCWIVDNSARRFFNLSPKHGENDIGNWPGESALLCSQEDAQNLLNSSIPNLDQKNRLFNWDVTHGTFIEFFFEGQNPQNQWHGFHLKESDWNRVPDTIRKFFKQ